MGKNLFDDDTGEVTEDIVYWRTAKQQEALLEQQEKRKQKEKEKQERERKAYIREKAKDGINPEYKEFGPFVWLIYTPLCDLNFGLNNMDMVRLIVLSTYMGYDGYLRWSAKSKLKQKDIPHALDISERSAKMFMSNLKKNNLITIEDDGGMKINDSIIYRGEIQRPKEYNVMTIRIYINSIRALYFYSERKMRSKLVYVFKLIPYMNRTYNIACYNTEETNSKELQIMTFGSFCDLVGYDRTNITRLKKELLSFKLKSKRIVAFITSEDFEKSSVCISPYVFFRGNNNNAMIDILNKHFEEQEETDD